MPREARKAIAPKVTATTEKRPTAPGGGGGGGVSPENAPALTPESLHSYDPVGSTSSAQESVQMATFGETLRRERELRQVSLREVAEATKINVRHLQALERNDFGFLPGGAFTRGFIRSYARYIGIDDVEMVNAYLYELAQQEESVPTATLAGQGVDRLREHFHLSGNGGGGGRRRARALIAVCAVAVLLALASLSLWALVSWWSSEWGEPAAAESEQPLEPGT